MTREMIINELKNRGYYAIKENIIKNGVELKAIKIAINNHVSQVIYTKEIIKNAEKRNISIEDVVSKIIFISENNKPSPFNLDLLCDKDFVMNNIYIGLQKLSSENIEKLPCTDFEGIEKYLYIRMTEQENIYAAQISESILEYIGISASEAWQQAQKNTEDESQIKSLAKVMCELLNIEYNSEMDAIDPLFVISNPAKFRGAAAILNKKILAKFGKEQHTNKIVVLPSSIHEMLLLPYTEEIDIDTFTEMVEQTNHSSVDPTEQLVDRAFIISV